MSRISRLLCLAVTLAALTLGARTARADLDEIEVFSTLDSGFGTLRAAIEEANISPFVRTITFDPALFGSSRRSITLTSPLPALTTSRRITMTAPAVGVEISGEGLARVLELGPAVRLAISGVTFRNGNAGLGNGGGILNAGLLTLTGCTFLNNSAASGGAVCNASNLTGATLTLVNCTFTGNSASTWGGAVFNASGLVKVVSCTISSNTASVSGGSGLASKGDAATRTEVSNSIVSGNGSPGATDVDFVGGLTQSIVSRDFNLVGDGNATVAFALFGDVTGNTNPGLGPIAENGGPTQTRLPLAGSPAINTGGQLEMDTDQRGVARAPYAPFDRGAVEVTTAISLVETLTVNTTGDEDNNTSDPRFGRGTSLREAMNYANRDGVDSVIAFDPVVFAAPRKTIILGGVQLPVIIWDGKFAIPAPPAGLEISGNNLSRVLHFADSVPGAPEADVTLTGLTIRDGRSDRGGGIANAGNLVMESCTVRDNFAQEGGGLFVQSYSFPVFIRNCTFSGNTATGPGGAISETGPLTLESSTITGNSSGVFSVNGNSTWIFTTRNSVIAGNGDWDVSIDRTDTGSSVRSQGYNLIGTRGPGVEAFVEVGDVTAVLDPDLAPLAENGGPTPTRMPLATSLAVNTGQTALTVDQRGISRPQPFGGAADKGAVEYNGPFDPALIVTTTSDVVNAADGVVSLREAVARANSDGVASPITFSETVFAAPRKTITLTGGALVLGGDSRLTIRAPAAGVRISGGGTSRVFETASDADVTLEDLTIASGNATGQSGGGILNFGGLELDRCTLTGNSATNGGAILSDTAASGRTLKLRNTTVSGNGAVTLCGGIYNRGGRTEIESCTITGNSSFAAGPNGIAALVDPSVTTDVRNSIVSGNGSGASTDVGLINGSTNSFVSGGYNLIGDGNATGAFNQTGDTIGNTDPGLSALAENGGPTPTRLPIVTSPAVQTGDTALRVDQRGVRRPQRGRFDRGACELDASAFIDSLVVTTAVDEDDQLSDPRFGTGTSLREAMNLANSDGVPSTITFDPAVFNLPRKRITLNGWKLPVILNDGLTTIAGPPDGVEVSGAGGTGIEGLIPVFQVNFGASASFSGLTIRDGRRIAGSGFESLGGGIAALGPVTVDHCTLIDNHSDSGGGIYSLFGPLIVRNSTFIGNNANLGGGAIGANQSVILDSCTITGNFSSGGGVNARSLQVRNCIIASNPGAGNGGDVQAADAASVQSNGYNLIGLVKLRDNADPASVFTQPGDQMIGTASPGLGPLQDNGGPTPTMGVLLTSPALNAGNTTLTLDQRGISRPRGNATDIGAFELIPLTIGPGVAPGAIGQAYSKNVAVTGGLAPYSISLVSGSLPPGLAIDGSGLISGTPLAGGSYSFTVQATDPLASLGQGSVSLQVGRISAPFAGDTAAWYRAEGNAQSFSGPAGTIGGTVGYAPGVVGQAFSFSGGPGYVALDPALFPVPVTGDTSTAPFSFETWFSTTGSGILLGQQGSGIAPYGTALGTIPAIYVGADGRLRVEMFWTGAINQVTSTGAVNDGNFHHVAAVYDGTSLIAYLDGTAIGSVAVTQRGYSTSYFYQLGTGYSPGNRPSLATGWMNFTGLLDETAIYRRALSAAEVQALWGAGSKGKSTVPSFTAISRSGSDVGLTLKHWPGLRFQLEYTPTLLPTSYLDLGASFIGDADGSTDALRSIPSGSSTGFFRAYEVP